jgi:hypothetical protein
MAIARIATGDFLRKSAQTPLRGYFMAAGAACELSTNCESILEAARETFQPVSPPAADADFRLRFWIDDGLTSAPPWPKPYVRGLGDMIFAGLDAQNSLLVDRRTLRAIGRFSPAMGRDRNYWSFAILPLVISIFGAAIGSTEIHSGCVASNGSGLLLAGCSGSGKSTLAWALGRLGFSILSDDRTCLSRNGNEVLAWSTSPWLKLRPETATEFPELARLVPSTFPNGQRAYSIQPDRDFGVPRPRSCKPRWLIFLKRRQGVDFRLAPMAPLEAIASLSDDLLAENPELSKIHLDTIGQLASCGSWQLTYSGSPSVVAEALSRFCEDTIRTAAC